MNTQDQQTTDRNDPAIDPDTPDNDMGQAKAPEATPAAQDQGGSQRQENTGNPSDGNSFTPDFEPDEHESPDTTSEHKDTGETDADIDTQGG